MVSMKSLPRRIEVLIFTTQQQSAFVRLIKMLLFENYRECGANWKSAREMLRFLSSYEAI
jgi:hypothetical protein